MLVATIQHNAYCTWLAALVIVTVSKDCTHAAHFRAVINILAAKFNSLPSPSLSLPTPTRLALSLNAPSITASGFIKPADSLLPKWRMKVSSLPASGFPFLMPLTKVCRAFFLWLHFVLFIGKETCSKLVSLRRCKYKCDDSSYGCCNLSFAFRNIDVRPSTGTVVLNAFC
jgi:hypothetical protein